MTTRLQDAQGNVVANRYEVNSLISLPGQTLLPSATFQASRLTANKATKPPSPRLIALHAACAQIAHKSGAIEHLKGLPGMTAALCVINELTCTLKKTQLRPPSVPRRDQDCSAKITVSAVYCRFRCIDTSLEPDVEYQRFSYTVILPPGLATHANQVVPSNFALFPVQHDLD